jgi:hypothetical protein
MHTRTPFSLLAKYVAIPLALGISGSALVALVALERKPVHAAIVREPEAKALEVRAPKGPPPLPAVLVATVEPALDEAAAAQPEAAEAKPAQATAVVVPDFTGKRLGAVRREAKKLGLKIAARDGYGERVPAELAPYYRVKKQLTETGSTVPVGSTVQVRVREVEGHASGY